MYPCVGICLCVQVPSEARKRYQIPEAEVIHSCELPHMGAGNWTQNLWEKTVWVLTCSVTSPAARWYFMFKFLSNEVNLRYSLPHIFGIFYSKICKSMFVTVLKYLINYDLWPACYATDLSKVFFSFRYYFLLL